MAERDPSRNSSSQTPSGDAQPPDQFAARRQSIGDEVTRSRSMSTGSDDGNATGRAGSSSSGPTQPGRHWPHWPRFTRSTGGGAQHAKLDENDVIFLG
ncbi:hypothetical protein BJX61DRAFT_542419 [Aspergillus egyptiacus]|nr:hypothetical protein BJX61DRAFT_542419 [Aspergillus egyptiacus]